ncbi:MAG: NAD(P)/FAD-dependent oxidoreductase [Armatimonadetes bacterium]|nr:NAD(P)/FAD-dependent oxidoreductase [Armatimonadota bacterium]
MKPVIIGAGPAGLTAAHLLAERGVPSILLEASGAQVGGLSRTVAYKGFSFDIGGHRFFSKNPEIEAFWDHMLGDEMLSVERLSRILYRGRFYDYPLRALNAFGNLGLLETFRCLASYLHARLFPRRSVRSFEDWVVNQFGWRLYEVFFKTYTEKVWGMPCGEISADWAAQRIKGLSLWGAIQNALLGGSAAKTLIDRFRYPRLGPGTMWERVAGHVSANGCDLRMNARVARILWGEDGAYAIGYTSDGAFGEVSCTDVISTMDLRALVEALEPAAPPEVRSAAAGLRYRDFLTVVLIVDQAEVFPDNWIYVHEPQVRVGRLQNYKRWSPEMVPDARRTGLGLEYFCFEGDGLWSATDEELIALGCRELEILGLVPASRVVDGTVVRVRKAYPVYDDGYRENVRLIRDFFEVRIPNLHFAGRNGMHRYNNQDHAMMTGLLAAERILGGTRDPWRVNADAEYLENASRDEPDDARAVPERVS